MPDALQLKRPLKRSALCTCLVAMAACVLPHMVLAENVAIPELESKGHVYKSEGPTDQRLYAKSTGTLRAVMLFVDFPDVTGDAGGTKEIAAHLLGHGKAHEFLRDQSFGQLIFEVTQVDGWKRMPKAVGEYVDANGHFDFDRHKAYLADACALFPDLDFSAYPIVLVVAAKTEKIALSPAFNAPPGEGAKAAHGEVRLAVTLGNDSYSNRYTNLLHEVLHLLGLPDLYRYSDGRLSVGPWDLMSDIFKATSLLGWHRHKLGWLAASRERYVPDRRADVRLTPLSSDSGISMVVIPLDDAEHPSKVLVAEIAEPILASNGKLWGEGVLIYSVDASIPTSQDPVVIFPRKTGDSQEYGRLFEAPYRAGDVFESQGIPVRIEILSKQGTSYEIAIRPNR